MKIQLITELPIWFTLFCLVLAFLVSWFLYRKDKAYKDVEKWIVWLMALLRFVFVFLISFLLLSPLVKSSFTKVEKPIIIIAQDNSESITYNKDSIYYKNDYRNEFNSFIDKLSKDYEIAKYSFDDNVSDSFRIDFTGKSTNYSKLINEVTNLYTNRNVGAFIFAGDGLYNEGSSPLVASSKMGYPIYTLAMGDTLLHKDIRISELNNNKFAFRGNNFPLQIYVEANGANGNIMQLSVIHNNSNVVFTKNISVVGNSFSKQIDTEILAINTGLQRYTIKLKTLNGELNTINNRRVIMVDVIDSKQKILILANSPHPDISALRQAISSNINFGIDFSLISKFKGDVKDYNLIVLHQLPSEFNAVTNIITEAKKLDIPCLYIFGSLSSIDKLNALNTGVQVSQNKVSFEDAQTNGNSKFQLFEFDSEQQNILNHFPPLLVPFGNYNTASNAEVFQYQQIKGIETNRPLILFNTVGNQKIGVIAGEGIWQWRIQNYVQSGNHELFDELMNKIVQFLSLRIKKERFVVNVKNVFNETETILFNAETYNKSYEAISSDDVSLKIINKNDKVYNFSFNKYGDAYRFDAGSFPVGDYNYVAKVELDNNLHTKRGRFTVLPINVEAINTQANHQLLYRMAYDNNGIMYYPQQWNELYNSIINNQNIVSVASTEEKLVSLINLKWIFFLLLAFISLEWFLRRYNGGY